MYVCMYVYLRSLILSRRTRRAKLNFRGAPTTNILVEDVFVVLVARLPLLFRRS